MKPSLLLALVLTLSSGLAWSEDDGVVSKGKPYRKTYKATAPVSVILNNAFGTCRLYESQTGKIEIQAETKSQNKVTVVSDLDGDTLSVDVKYPKAGGNGASSTIIVNGKRIQSKGGKSIKVLGDGTVIVDGKVVQGDEDNAEVVLFEPVSLSLGVPPDLLSDVDIKTTDGDIAINGAFKTLSADRVARLSSVDGTIDLVRLAARKIQVKAEDGDIRLHGVTAYTTAELEDGNIFVEGGEGFLALTSEDGDIRVHGGRGNINARTEDGDIRVTERVAERIEGTATDGNIFFYNPKAEQERGNSEDGSVTYTNR